MSLVEDLKKLYESEIFEGDTSLFRKSLEEKYGKDIFLRTEKRFLDNHGMSKENVPTEKITKEDVRKVLKAITGKDKQQKIPKDIQALVDVHIENYNQYKSLEKMLAMSREVLEPYMEENGITSISGTNGGKIERESTNRAIINAIYTSYEYDNVEPFLNKETKAACVERVINRDKLEALVSVGKIPKEVRDYKVSVPSMNFSVK